MKLSYSTLTPLQQLLVVLAVGIGITLTTGAVCGRMSHRWGPRADMVAAAEHLRNLPTQIGNWKSMKDDKLSDTVVQTLACAGYVNRTYVNQSTGDTVTLAIIVGPSGPISVHTPEICYSSQAYSITEPRQAQQVADGTGKTHAFWRTIFRSTNPTAEQLCVYYGWCANRDWTAAESPRFEFAGQPMLFKLQLASLVPPGKVNEQSACEVFLRDLLNSGWKIKG